MSPIKRCKFLLLPNARDRPRAECEQLSVTLAVEGYIRGLLSFSQWQGHCEGRGGRPSLR